MKQLEGVTNSFELFNLINEHRVVAGKKPMKYHRDLVEKIKDEIGEEKLLRKKTHKLFTEHKYGNREFDAYELNRQDVFLVSMRESKEVRKSIYEYIVALEEENQVLQGIVWQVINGKNYLPQELGAQAAGIERPRLFMRYLKGREHVLESFMERGYLEYKRVGKTDQDKAWRWSQAGFQYILKNRGKLNLRVKELHDQQREGLITF